jgi:Zn finger protein HypA/HybF involved in hydrogenase expression
MQYECTECSQMGRFFTESEQFTAPCPVCDQRTVWAPAFEGEGISF